MLFKCLSFSNFGDLYVFICFTLLTIFYLSIDDRWKLFEKQTSHSRLFEQRRKQTYILWGRMGSENEQVIWDSFSTDGVTQICYWKVYVYYGKRPQSYRNFQPWSFYCQHWAFWKFEFQAFWYSNLDFPRYHCYTSVNNQLLFSFVEISIVKCISALLFCWKECNACYMRVCLIHGCMWNVFFINFM